MANELARFSDEVKTFFVGKETESANCLCGSQDIRSLFVKDKFLYCKCTCGIIFIYNQPTTGVLERFYESQAMALWAGFKETDMQRQSAKFNSILPYLEDVESILDLGCGTGVFVNVMANTGKRVLGVDVTVPKGPHFVKQNILKFLEGDQQWDCITLWGVFEHLKHPVSLLQKIKKNLTGPKRVVVCVPNVESLVVKELKSECFTFCPQHLWYFSRDTLKKTMQDSGFIERAFYTIEPEAGPIISQMLGLPAYSKNDKNYFKVQLEDFILKNNLGYKLVGIYEYCDNPRP